jgi:glutathione S-transferase
LRLSDALGGKAYLDGDRFTAGDLMMATVLRITDGKGCSTGIRTNDMTYIDGFVAAVPQENKQANLMRSAQPSLRP